MASKDELLESLKREFSSTKIYRTREEASKASLEFHRDPEKITPFRGGWRVNPTVPIEACAFPPDVKDNYYKWVQQQPDVF